MKGKHKVLGLRPCKGCGTEFEPVQTKQEFCTPRCGSRFRTAKMVIEIMKRARSKYGHKVAYYYDKNGKKVKV